MEFAESIEAFEQFARGDFVRSMDQLGSAAVRLVPRDMDIGGGRMQLHEIDALKNYPEAEILTVSGLDQAGFEYLIRNYGQQFRVLQFFKNKLVEDWSLLGTLPGLEYVYYFFNQRIESLWDMTNNKKLKGISIMDFSRLKTISGIEKAENLEYFSLGNAVWDKCVVDSYRFFADTNVRYLSFSGKKILDRDPGYLTRMPRLEAVRGVLRGLTKAQVAWVKANGAKNLDIGIKVIQWPDRETREPSPLVLLPWKGQRSYRLTGNEARYARDMEQFRALVEGYQGVSYESAFGEKTE